MPRMNPEIKKRWVAALRSGKYRQGKYSLKDRNGGYCCLGVLQQLAADEGIVEGVFTCESFLSPETIRWSELTHPALPNYYFVESREASLDQLNDKLDLSFTEIADIIEAEF